MSEGRTPTKKNTERILNVSYTKPPDTERALNISYTKLPNTEKESKPDVKNTFTSKPGPSSKTVKQPLIPQNKVVRNASNYFLVLN